MFGLWSFRNDRKRNYSIELLRELLESSSGSSPSWIWSRDPSDSRVECGQSQQEGILRAEIISLQSTVKSQFLTPFHMEEFFHEYEFYLWQVLRHSLDTFHLQQRAQVMNRQSNFWMVTSVILLLAVMKSADSAYEEAAPVEQYKDLSPNEAGQGIFFPPSELESPEEAELNEELKRAEAWNKLHGGWGKRVSQNWNRLHSGWGKRNPQGWNNLHGMIGKRGWNDMYGGYGKRGWNDMSGSWGKRQSSHWNNLRGMWGKRAAPPLTDLLTADQPNGRTPLSQKVAYPPSASHAIAPSLRSTSLSSKSSNSDSLPSNDPSSHHERPAPDAVSSN